jgi:hypothetical protein
VRIITITFDRIEGSSKGEAKATIEEALALLKPLRGRVRFRVTASHTSLTEDKRWNTSRS